MATDPIDTFLSEWHRIVGEKNLTDLRGKLAPDISMGAPPYWNKLQDRDMVHHLLGIVINTIEDFTYHREWREGREIALEFTGHVGGLDVQGIDLITLDAQSLVQNLDVLMRPINSVLALRDAIAPQMAAYLARRAESREDAKTPS